MRNNVEAGWVPPEAYEYSPHFKYNDRMPQLDPTQLTTNLLVGGARIGLKAPVAGDFTLALSYRDCLGAVVSYQEHNENDLHVLQLQGAKPAGLRISAVMRWAGYFAEQSLKFVQDPGTTYTRLIIPAVVSIQGIGNMSQEAMDRYREFVVAARMRYSTEENQFIRDFSAPAREI